MVEYLIILGVITAVMIAGALLYGVVFRDQSARISLELSGEQASNGEANAPTGVRGLLAQLDEFWKRLMGENGHGGSFSSGNGGNETPWDPSKNLGIPQCTMQAGNPIHIGSGNKYQREVDYLAATGLSFVRHYNSSVHKKNWQHNWQQNIMLSSAQNTLTMTRPDGKVDTFKLSGSEWKSEGVTAKLLSLKNAQNEFAGWEYQPSVDEREIYNAQGQLIRLINKQKQQIELIYTQDNHQKDISGQRSLPNGLLWQIRDLFGHEIRLEYDDKLRLAQMTDPAGGVYQYTYDQNNNLISATYPDGATRRYHYENKYYEDALTGITDENELRFATWTYDSSGRAISSEHGEGVERVKLQFNEDRSTTVTDALGNQHITRYRAVAGVLRSTEISQPSGAGCDAAASKMSYDPQGNLLSKVDFNGNKSCFYYDPRTNLEVYRLEGLESSKSCPNDINAYQLSAKETKSSIQWHPRWHQPAVLTLPGEKIILQYDDVGNLITKIRQETQDLNGGQGFDVHPVGHVKKISYQYSGTGHLVQIDGARNDVNDITNFEYDDQGRLIRTINALKQVTSFSNFDAHGRPLTVITPDKITTNYQYDLRGRLTKLTRGVEETHFTYDRAGNLLYLGRGDQTLFQFEYDAAHRLTKIYDALGNSLNYKLDAAGNQLEKTIKNNFNKTVFYQRNEFDALSRLHKMIDEFNQPQQSRFYDANGNLTSITLPDSSSENDSNKEAGNESYRYDRLNRLVAETDRQGQVVQYDYDPKNKVNQVIDPRALKTHYTLKPDQAEISLNSPDTGLSRNQYDVAGNLIRKIKADGQQILYRYDALNRISAIEFPGKKQQDMKYFYGESANAINQLSRIQDASGETRLKYNSQGALAEVANQYGNRQYTTAYKYDTSGLLRRIIYPSGRMLEYQVDAMGQVNRIESIVAGRRQTIIDNVRYQPFGGVASYQYGDGSQSAQRSYDAQGRIVGFTLANNFFAVQYDHASRVAGITNKTEGERTYKYNLSNQLIAYRSDAEITYNFEYDANGNRTRQLFNKFPVSYRYAQDSNRLLEVEVENKPAQKQKYNQIGQIIADETRAQTYQYDARGALIQVNNAQGASRYTVNALGQRVRKQTSKEDILYFYDKNNLLIAELPNTANAAYKEYIYLGQIPVAMIQADGQIQYIHTDHLNTPRLVTNLTGEVVWRWKNNDPFGNNAPDIQTVELNLRFAGQYADKESGLNYNHYRYYDPRLGRYTSSDPIGLAGGINTYAYVENSPLNKIDPFGLSARDVERLKETFDYIVAYMNGRGMRYPSPSWATKIPGMGWYWGEVNNFGVTMDVIAEYFFKIDVNDHHGCADQASVAKNMLITLTAGHLDAKWTFTAHNNMLYPLNHWWVVATSSDPNDPELNIDTWKNSFSVSPPPSEFPPF